jgi:hypothetical protein
MIATLNETALHRTLKVLYAEKTGGAIEQEIEGRICDVVTPAGGIIEIQTANVSKLAPKVASLIDRREITIVFPVTEKKLIQKIDENGEVISERKSPKAQTVYAIFREITGLYPWLFHRNFTLEALPVTVREIRAVTEEPVQTANKRRRHLRCWYKTDKALVSYGEARVFKTPEDYLALLPAKRGEEFTPKDLRPTPAGKDTPLMLWVLDKCGLIRLTRVEGRKKFYEIVP